MTHVLHPHIIGLPYLAKPVFEYIATQNAEACLMHCTPDVVPNEDVRTIITEVCITLRYTVLHVSQQQHLNLFPTCQLLI